LQARTWAIDAAAGLGYLLAQQLVAAGETVVDVPATLSARVRLLGSSQAGKNDPNDARSAAIAGLRHAHLRVVERQDHPAVGRLLADRHHALTGLRTQAVCRGARAALRADPRWACPPPIDCSSR
jgi:transposase